MRPVRILTTAIVVATLTAAGCASRTATPASTAPSSVPTTQPTAAPTTRSTAGTTDSTTTVTVPATASCTLSPNRGPAESRVTLSCRGFVPAEGVEVSFGATVLATARATTGGQVAASFAVPGGFAGSTIPGRKDTFQAKGRQSGRVTSATFTVTG